MGCVIFWRGGGGARTFWVKFWRNPNAARTCMDNSFSKGGGWKCKNFIPILSAFKQIFARSLNFHWGGGGGATVSPAPASYAYVNHLSISWHIIYVVVYVFLLFSYRVLYNWHVHTHVFPKSAINAQVDVRENVKRERENLSTFYTMIPIRLSMGAVDTIVSLWL